jgi:hypothetical protein
MSDAGSKDKAVTPASKPLNKGEVMGDIGLYEVLAAVVDIKAYILVLGPVTGPVCGQNSRRSKPREIQTTNS